MLEAKTDLGQRAMVEIPAGSDKFPCLIFLHGIGEIGTTLSKVLKHGPLRQLQEGVSIGEPKVIFCPQNLAGQWTVAEIDDAVEFCKKTYPVDPNRIYLMGISLGGLGVWTYAQSPEHVKKIAAIVPICGGGNDPSKAYVLVNEGIPGWAAHARNDDRVKFDVTARMVTAVNDMAKRKQILFSEYGLFGHTAWGNFLKPEYGVYDWLRYQRLDARTPVNLDVFKKKVTEFVNAL